MAHRVAKVNIVYAPAVALKLMDDHPMKVQVVHGIVRAKGGGIVIERDAMISVRGIVGAEVCNECRNLALEFHVERFEYIKAVAARLTAYNPIDIGIVVYANAQRSERVEVRIGAAVKGRMQFTKATQRAYGIPLLLRLFDDSVVTERVEVREIRRSYLCHSCMEE